MLELFLICQIQDRSTIYDETNDETKIMESRKKKINQGPCPSSEQRKLMEKFQGLEYLRFVFTVQFLWSMRRGKIIAKARHQR